MNKKFLAMLLLLSISLNIYLLDRLALYEYYKDFMFWVSEEHNDVFKEYYEPEGDCQV